MALLTLQRLSANQDAIQYWEQNVWSMDKSPGHPPILHTYHYLYAATSQGILLFKTE